MSTNPTYREFCDYARRYDQVELLTGIARTASALPDTADDPRYRQTPPWALAGLAKASICNGNRYRSMPIKANTIPYGCAMYSNLAARELEQPGLNSGFSILVRIAYEQFPYQESGGYEDMARPETFFGGYSGRKQLEVVNSDTLAQLLGAPLLTAVGVTLILHASAAINAGFFDPALIDQANFAEVLRVVPRDRLLSVIDSVFVNDFTTFKRQVDEAPPLPFLERYMFNPLTARPLIRLGDGRLLAPVPQLITVKLSPIELYYAGIHRWGEPFARDMGELLEDYVGRQFASLPDAEVHPEVTYTERKNTLKSVDWIVVFKDMVLLVEAKATRTPAAARAADETVQDTYQSRLGKAFKQISQTYRAIQDGRPEFSQIPSDRPIFGMVATLDPWYLANSLAREFLPKTDVTTTVASVREIEHLIAIGQRRPTSGVLGEVLSDAERRTWELNTALTHYSEDTDRNPLIDKAWSRSPFSPESRRYPTVQPE